jgi:hypothetical protein
MEPRDTKSKSVLVLTALVCVILAAGINLAIAGNAASASVWAEDSSGTYRNKFNIGETMYIYWNEAPSGSTVDINVTDSVGNVLASWVNQPESANGTLTYTFPSAGYYFVVCNGAQPFPIAVATIYVVPESVLGTISIVAIGFAAYAIVKMKPRKK